MMETINAELGNAILTAAFSVACERGLSPVRLAREMFRQHAELMKEMALKADIRKRTLANTRLTDICQRCGADYDARYGRHGCYK